MVATLNSVLTADANRRREKAERAAKMPPEQVRAHNGCIEALVELPPQVALVVVQRVARSISEFIAVESRRGL